MANRFTDSRKWDDPWFRKMPCKYKAFWFFLLDKCNHAGIWKVDFESASFHIGEELIEAEVKNILVNRVYAYKDKWFISKFIFFQYGVLSEANRVHMSVLNILEKEGLSKVYQQTLLGRKDMVKDKVKDKNKGRQDFDFDMIWSEYPNKIGRRSAEKHFRASVKTLKDFTDIQGALVNYKSSKRVKSNYIQNGSTWFCNWRDWVELPKNEKFCDKCKGTGKFISATGFECVCDCGAK